MEKLIIRGLAILPTEEKRVLKSTPHPLTILDPKRPLVMPGADAISMLYTPRGHHPAMAVLMAAYRVQGITADRVEVRIRTQQKSPIEHKVSTVSTDDTLYLHRLAAGPAKDLYEVSSRLASKQNYKVRRPDAISAPERLSVVALHPHLLVETLATLGWRPSVVIHPIVSGESDRDYYGLWITVFNPKRVETANLLYHKEQMYEVML